MESTKHGAAAGNAEPPISGDWTIDQGWESYTAEEHAVWKTLYERQSKLLPGRACDEFIRGMRDLAMDTDRIPDFRRLSDVLGMRTGWRVVAVPGLVPDEVFFDHLANRRFPAGQFIRRPDQLDYLEEPDVFHDVFGHVPMLAHPVFADYMEAYGKGGLRAQGMGVLANLARVYWYTVEFGLIRSGNGLGIYGSGIASSYTETIFALEDPSPNRIRFDLERVMRTLYRIDDFQETYFVIDSFDELLTLADIDFGPIYQRVAALPDLEPGTIDPGDEVLDKGTGAYHSARRRVA
ncbi:phenylalanine 4-monooxygenase [Skermanella pratensis]|uniref:phenylalanine 4-monooxygenase n=1 Tax=Skermanella pratensis TaxID=2233999 RepID=UPI001300F979|nr:phenylalanine 4-monooxygenase [Skermanella pratensis]